ncbi:MAG: hypothetical protein AAF666_03865 [Pseudomonadota bacterium]
MTAAILIFPVPAFAESPDQAWNQPWVQVTGGSPAEQNSVSAGLNAANEVYFYGDLATKMIAAVTGPGRVDLRIVNQSSGAVLAERSGVRFDSPASLEAATLDWMDQLVCRDNCAFAEASATPVQVAEDTPAPASTQTDAVVTALADQDSPDAAETDVAATTPATAEESTAQIAAAELLAPAAPAAGAEIPELPQTSGAETAAASVEEEQPIAEQLLAVREPTVPTEAETPSSTSAAPSTGTTDAVPTASTLVSTPEPTIGPATAAGSLVPSAPLGGATEALPVVAESTDVEPPAPAEVASPPSRGGVDADAVLARAAPERPVQEVAPGIVLPEPRPGDLVTPVAESVGLTPEASRATETAPAASQVQVASQPSSATSAQPTGSAASAAAVASTGSSERPTVATDPSASTAVSAVTPTASSAAETPSVTSQSDAPSVPTVGTTDGQEPSVASATPEADSEASTASASEQLAQELEAALRQPTAPSAEADSAVATAAPSASTTPEAPASSTSSESPVAAEAPATPPADEPEAQQEQLALLTPPTQEVPAPTAETPLVTPTAPAAEDTPLVEDSAPAGDPAGNVNTQIAAVDPNAGGPTLANARWVGFTPAVHTGKEPRGGSWIAGPFDRKERVGWITDTATGATTRVTFIWREGGRSGRTAELSSAAASALGLGQGDVANVAVYLPR